MTPEPRPIRTNMELSFSFHSHQQMSSIPTYRIGFTTHKDARALFEEVNGGAIDHTGRDTPKMERGCTHMKLNSKHDSLNVFSFPMSETRQT